MTIFFFPFQETYNLNVSLLSSGLVPIPGQEENLLEPLRGLTGLNSFQLEMLGKLAFNRGYYDRALEWEEGAREVARKEGDMERVKAIR